ncbi:MAG: hypothetical protein ACR2NK_10550 [Mariniblastus sp.]
MEEPKNPYDSPKDFSNEASEQGSAGYLSAVITGFYLLAFIALVFVFFMFVVYAMKEE